MIGSTSRLSALFSLAAALALALAAGPAEAQKRGRKGQGKKKAGAAAPCGLDFLPLVEGTEWTYEPFVPESAPDVPGLHTERPPSLTVKVTAVKESGSETHITVEESWRKVAVSTELVCTKDGLRVPPQSFFFAGEPGGGVGMELTDLKSTGGDTYAAGKKGLAGETYVEFKAQAVRTPAEGSGATIPPANLEVERKMVVRGRETTESSMGEHKAVKVQVQTTGRAALAAQKDKPFNMPAVDSLLWFAPGVGLVRAETSAGTGWKLTGHKLPGAE